MLRALCLAVAACLLVAAPALADDAAAQVEKAWLTQLAIRQSAPRQSAPQGQASSGALTTQSDAAGGVDGIKNGGFGFHTNQEDKPWWQADLGRREPLGRVVVWNRCTPDGARAARLHVLLSGDGKSWRTVYEHDGTVFGGASDNKPLGVSLGGAEARFVRIQLPERTWLHLDEVEVFGQKNLPAEPVIGE